MSRHPFSRRARRRARKGDGLAYFAYLQWFKEIKGPKPTPNAKRWEVLKEQRLARQTRDKNRRREPAPKPNAPRYRLALPNPYKR